MSRQRIKERINRVRHEYSVNLLDPKRRLLVEENEKG